MAVPERHVRQIGETVIETIERQDWLDVIGDRLQRAVAAAFAAGGDAGRRVRDVLHGTWLGHPLHTALTDVPLGAWTTALALDTAGGRGMGRAADAAIGVGIAGAVASAVTGLTDWQHTTGGDRRVGLGHALLNSTALTLYVTSLLLRRRGARAAGRRVSALGFLVVVGAAYVGGSLVYKKRIGVDHAPRPEPWDEFVPVLAEAELATGAPRRVEARGVSIVLVRRDQRIHALADSCAHLGGPLSEGRVEGQAIRCPWHGSLFALADGRVLEGPSTFPQPCFEVRVRGGQVELRPRPAGR
jgi:nitrite reductase/ring-hydroxylating ferredoxin subunit